VRLVFCWIAVLLISSCEWLEPGPAREAEAWGLAGRASFASAARMMREHNPAPATLSAPTKAALRPYFGDLVDAVRVVWEAALADQWALGRFSVPRSSWGGQTYGDDIYLSQAEEPGSEGQLEVLAHEMVHVVQTRRLGGLDGFGYEYFKDYYNAGLRYEEIALEKEAYAFEAAFAKARRAAR